MPIDPFLEAVNAALPSFPDRAEDLPAFRAADFQMVNALADELAEPGPQVKDRQDISVPVGKETIDVVIYQPFGDGPHPAHVYLHGGGWVSGTIKNKVVDIICRERCAGANCIVAALEWPKAPEHKFPTSLNQSYAALLWLVEHTSELGIRPELITIGGGSSGANLAAAITLKIRDHGGPTLALQLLEVPALDLTLSSPSIHTLGQHYFPTTREYHKVIAYYLNTPNEASNPYVSPLLAPDLSGLPPAHIMSAEYDPLRDDAARYAQRLNDAGVATTYSLQRGHLHVSGLLTKAFPPARAWRAEVLTVLRRSTAQAPSPPTTRTAANRVPSDQP
jgi:acetyl esterase